MQQKHLVALTALAAALLTVAPAQAQSAISYSDSDPANAARVTTSAGTVSAWVGTSATGDLSNIRIDGTGVRLRATSGDNVRLLNAAGAGIRLDDTGTQITTTADMTGHQITGLADGAADTDAATMGQVRSLTAAAAAAGAGAAAVVAPVAARVGALETRVEGLSHSLSGGIAAAAALAQPVAFADGAKNAISGGIANYNGSGAMALAYNRLVVDRPGQKILVSAGASLSTSGELVTRVGGSLSW